MGEIIDSNKEMDPREAWVVNPEGRANWERDEVGQCQSVYLEGESIESHSLAPGRKKKWTI